MAASVKGIDYNYSGLQFTGGQWQDRILVQVTGATGATGDADAITTVRAYNAGMFDLNVLSPKNNSMTVSGWAIASADQANGVYGVYVIYEVPVGGQHAPEATNADALLALPAQVSWSWGFYEEPTEVDIYGKPITNSAGDVFDPPLTIERVEGIMTLTKYKRGYDAGFWADKIGKVNSADCAMPGLGTALKRTAQLLSVTPATSYVAMATIPFTYGLASPVFVVGDLVSFGGGGGTATVTGVTAAVGGAATITVTAITKSLAVSTSITAASGANGTTSAAVPVAPVQHVLRVRYRRVGFDRAVIDQGLSGYWKTVDNTPFIGRILNIKDRSEVPGPVMLHLGAPSLSSHYVANSESFNAWDTSQDALAARTTGGTPEVVRTTTGSMDLLIYKRIEETDFSAFGI